MFMEFINAASLNFTEGYHVMEEEKFPIWSRRSDLNSFYIVDVQNLQAIGPLERYQAGHTYLQANSLMEEGSSRGPWNYGFYVLFNAAPISDDLQQFITREANEIFPSITCYRWTEQILAEVSIDWQLDSKLPEETLTALEPHFKELSLGWFDENAAYGFLTEMRNHHIKGSLVVTEAAVVDAALAIVDEFVKPC